MEGKTLQGALGTLSFGRGVIVTPSLSLFALVQQIWGWEPQSAGRGREVRVLLPGVCSEEASLLQSLAPPPPHHELPSRLSLALREAGSPYALWASLTTHASLSFLGSLSSWGPQSIAQVS